jgi:sulfite exporter TauE/SafE
MNLDLRVPMGLMFTLVGIILTAFGIATRGNMELYARSLGVNVNIWWGIVLLIFGLIMFQLGRTSQARLAKLPPPTLDEDAEPRRGH